MVRFARTWAVLIAAGLLAGCAGLDQFAGRQSHYNTEAEKAQDQAILLNILRADKQRPLSFTELQSVTSSGTPSGSLGVSVPFAQNGGQTAGTFSPTLALSGGPTLSAGFINTQDFYQGILKPIPLSTIDLFVQRGIPSNLLFNLLFSRVIVKKIQDPSVKTPAETFVAINDVGTERRLAGYQTLIEILLNRGLTTGPGAADSNSFGPPLTDEDLAQGDLATKAAAAGMQLKEADWCELSGVEMASLARRAPFALSQVKPLLEARCKIITGSDPNAPGGKAQIDQARKDIAAGLVQAEAPLVYRLTKPGANGGFRFCIAGPRSVDGQSEVNPGICRADNELVGHAKPASANTVRIAKLPGARGPAEDPLCEALNDLGKSGPPLDCHDPNWDGEGFEVELEPRSTYSVIYYLGEVVRRELPPRGADEQGFTPRFVTVKLGDRLRAIPPGPCAGIPPVSQSGYGCENLFYLRPGDSRGYLTVRYDGRSYTIPDDALGGKSNEVLDIVNELIALNHSSKDAPTSSLLTVIGVQ
jgi:hypothetical protein